MFVGHYGVSYAAKATENRLPLWLLFLAVQLVDILWACFVLLGIERVRIVPGITASSPLDLYYMPYTHSLVGALAWSALAFGFCQLVPRWRGVKCALVLALAVFSHWVIDLIVHRPDLAIYGDSMKVGFGLWNHRLLAFLLECAVLIGGVIWYLRVTRPLSRAGTIVPITITAFMLLIQYIGVFVGRPLASPKVVAINLLFFYFVFAVLALWIEIKRAPK